MRPIKLPGSVKLSSFVEPMKATLSDIEPFDSDDWVFEIKWDGYRAVAELENGARKLYSRNGLTYDKAYPKVFEALKEIKKNVILDGEIVVFDEHGKPNFQKLQNYRNTDKYAIRYYVFDCLELDGKSLASLPLVERKAILQKLIPASSLICYCDHVEGEGKALFREITKMNMEGMIAKRKKSSYQVGRRSADWLKIKSIQTQEAIIVGFTAPKGARQHFGSLLLAVNKNGKLTSIGNVGTGFTDRSLKDLHGKLSQRIRKTSPLDVPIKETADITWVEPELVCNINFTEITEDGSARHPVFQGLRVDKGPKEVALETPAKVKPVKKR